MCVRVVVQRGVSGKTRGSRALPAMALMPSTTNLRGLGCCRLGCRFLGTRDHLCIVFPRPQPECFHGVQTSLQPQGVHEVRCWRHHNQRTPTAHRLTSSRTRAISGALKGRRSLYCASLYGGEEGRWDLVGGC